MSERKQKRGHAQRQAIYAFIAQHINEKHYAPTFREIMRHSELHSVSAVSYHLDILKQQGRITYCAGLSRTIQVII